MAVPAEPNAEALANLLEAQPVQQVQQQGQQPQVPLQQPQVPAGAAADAQQAQVGEVFCSSFLFYFSFLCSVVLGVFVFGSWFSFVAFYYAFRFFVHLLMVWVCHMLCVSFTFSVAVRSRPACIVSLIPRVVYFCLFLLCSVYIVFCTLGHTLLLFHFISLFMPVTLVLFGLGCPFVLLFYFICHGKPLGGVCLYLGSRLYFGVCFFFSLSPLRRFHSCMGVRCARRRRFRYGLVSVYLRLRP